MNKVISNLACGAKRCATATVKKAKSFVSNPRMGMLAMMLLVVSVHFRTECGCRSCSHRDLYR